jgi:hypothetical protein
MLDGNMPYELSIEDTEDNPMKLYTGQPVTELKFEAGSSRM